MNVIKKLDKNSIVYTAVDADLFVAGFSYIACVVFDQMI